MLWRLAPDSPEPIYQQLMRQLRAAIVSGRLRPGDRVSSHRELAAELVINHLTIKRAFEELEREGLLTTKRGLGTYVSDPLPKGHADAGSDHLAEALERAAQAAHELGLKRQDWLRLAADAWKDKT